MTGSDPIRGTAVWTDGQRAETVQGLIDRLGPAANLIGVGGPRHPAVDELARGLDCPRIDDFRQLLVDLQPGAVLITTLTGVSNADIETACRRGVSLLTTEPIAGPAGSAQEPQAVLVGTKTAGQSDVAQKSPPTAGASDIQDAAPGEAAHQEGRVVWMPGLEWAPGWLGAAEPTEVLGDLAFIDYACYGQQRECSLYARLYDAWRFIIRLAGLADTINASLVGPLPDVPTDPRGLTGTIAAHARLPGNRAAVVTLSDCSGDWNRLAQISGEGGHLRVGDFEYTLYNGQGECLDSLAPPTEMVGYTQLLRDRWRLWAGGKDALVEAEGRPAVDERAIQACCLTCLLSARTGVPESPDKMMRLHQC